MLAQIEVGSAPHGIAFRGDRAFVALSGGSEIVQVDVHSLEVVERAEHPGTPLDLWDRAGTWIATAFRADRLRALGSADAGLAVGAGPSLFAPLPRGRRLLALERANELVVLGATGSFRSKPRFPVGARPVPPAATADGILAFVPGYDAGNVTVVDLLNGEVLTTVALDAEARSTAASVGPTGGATTLDGVSYVVACAASGELVFINTASFEITARMPLDARPFSVVPLKSADGAQRALVNLSGADGVALVDLDERRVVERVATGAAPIVIRVEERERGEQRAWVANEDAGTLTVLGLPPAGISPEAAGATADLEKSEVVVLGMIHGGHTTSAAYGIEVVRAALRRIEPDFICTEIPPNRFDVALATQREGGRVTEPRVARFPEYVDAVFPLQSELGYTIVPTAGWSEPMARYRRRALARIEADPARGEDWRRYQAAMRSMEEAISSGGPSDDPLWIHTDDYDAATDVGFQVYNELFNDELGPGGWDRINAAHYAPIAAALDRHRGEGRRFLVTYGAAHKGWLRRALAARDDVVLLDARAFFAD